jgi:hypothetical protein
VYTLGISEIGFASRKKCRLCGHQLSLHKGADAKTVQPAVSYVAPVVETSHEKAPKPSRAPAAPGPALDPFEVAISCKSGDLGIGDDFVAIRRSPMAVKMSRLPEETKIALSNIVGIEVREPTGIKPGELLFVVSDEALGGTAPKQKSHSKLLGFPFVKSERDRVLAIKGNIEERVAHLDEAGPTPEPEEAQQDDQLAAPAHQPPVSLADEMKKLADLHEAGLLTDEEFSASKASLLNP